MADNTDSPSRGPQARPPLKQSYHHGSDSDLTILTYGPQPVHKAVVCAQSKVIAHVCDGGIDDSDCVRLDDEDGHLYFPGMFHEVSEAVLEFMYTSDYSTPSSPLEPFGFHTGVYLAAFKLDIPDLAELAMERLGSIYESPSFEIHEFILAVYTVSRQAPSSELGKVLCVAASEAVADIFDFYYYAKPELYLDFVKKLKKFGTDFQDALHDSRALLEFQGRRYLACNTGMDLEKQAIVDVQCPRCDEEVELCCIMEMWKTLQELQRCAGEDGIDAFKNTSND